MATSSCRRASLPTDSAMARTASRGSMKQRGMSLSRLSGTARTRDNVNPVSDGETAGVLWGHDHEELGEIGTLAVGDRAGLANSRGRYPKAYRYEDPNEDTVAALVGP